MQFFPWKPACCLSVSGPDAFDFLQGQFTNDLRQAQPSGSVYGLWLTIKGKVLADSFVVAAQDAFRVISYHTSAEILRARLESHIIADDVTIEDLTGTTAGLTILGDDAATSAPPADPGIVRFAGRRGISAVEYVGGASAIHALASALPSSGELSADAMAARRIRAGVPAIPTDIGPSDLPNEGGLDVDAISYTKGCFLGQEVMARLKSMGQVRRRLEPVEFTQPPPGAGTRLFQGDRQVGELRSYLALDERAGIGLAMLTLLHFDADKGFGIAPQGAVIGHVISKS